MVHSESHAGSEFVPGRKTAHTDAMLAPEDLCYLDAASDRQERLLGAHGPRVQHGDNIREWRQW
jgi:hypothetical protein